MRKKKSCIGKQSYWFMAPTFLIYILFFIVPTVLSIYYSLSIWSIKGAKFCGLKNYMMFFSEYSLSIGVKNTFIYAFLTSGIKVLLSFLIAIFLTGKIKSKNILRAVVFFPNLVSMVAVGIMFKAIMNPTKGYLNAFLNLLGMGSINWLGDRNLALFSVALVDIWKGISISTVIFVAGLTSIDKTYYEAASIDGANRLETLKYISIPLSESSRNTIIILSLIGGFRSFELIWTMTGGGPGFASDVMSSIIYKQYIQGIYGLSSAGNVILMILISVVIFPLQWFLNKSEEALQ